MKTVLFVCVHNAGRSVMAEAFCNALSDGAVRGISAGTNPSGGPHPEVVEAMAESGIDISTHRGRVLDDELASRADRIVTMGCAVDTDACPAVLYREVEDWGLPDPKGAPVEQVRAIRDEVRARVQALLDEMRAQV